MWDRKLLFTLDSFGLTASSSLSKGRKTQPLLEQNVLVKTTHLPKFKHLLIKAMPRKQDLLLCNLSRNAQSCFLPNPCTVHCKRVSVDQQALLAGSAFLDRKMFVWSMRRGFKKKKVFVLLFIGTTNKEFKWSFYLSCLSHITIGNLECWELSANSWKFTDICMHSHNIWLKLWLKVPTMKMLFVAGVGLFFFFVKKTGLFNYLLDWDFASETPVRS